jgi:hypothetical protein
VGQTAPLICIDRDNEKIKRRNKIMKSIFIIACTLICTLSVHAERFTDQYFQTKEECEESCQALLAETATSSFSVFLDRVTDKKEEIGKQPPLVTLIDQLKEHGGDFECVQKVGERKLGDLFFKVGYLVKYEKTAFFIEFVIIRSDKGYQPKMNDFEFNPKTSELLKKIPDYCWQ